jgi:hypothetical protein
MLGLSKSGETNSVCSYDEISLHPFPQNMFPLPKRITTLLPTTKELRAKVPSTSDATTQIHPVFLPFTSRSEHQSTLGQARRAIIVARYPRKTLLFLPNYRTLHLSTHRRVPDPARQPSPRHGRPYREHARRGPRSTRAFSLRPPRAQIRSPRPHK